MTDIITPLQLKEELLEKYNKIKTELEIKKKKVNYLKYQLRNGVYSKGEIKPFIKTYFYIDNVAPGTEHYRFGYVGIPWGYVGFIFEIGTSRPGRNGIEASIYIDGSPIEGMHTPDGKLYYSVGSLEDPKKFVPPFLVNRKFETFVTQPSTETKNGAFSVVIDGYLLKLPSFGEETPEIPKTARRLFR